MPGRRPLVRRSLTAAALTGAAAASVRALVRPRPGAEHRLIDWEAARRIARARSGERVRLRADKARRLASLYQGYAAEMLPHMAEAFGAVPAELVPVAVLDRHAFIDANLEIARRLLDPVERLRASAGETNLSALGRRLTSRYMGELFGLMSQRALGQFDPVLMLPEATPTVRPASSLFLVEPNIELFEREQGVPAEPLRRWLILHEATHAWQFEAHPWLAAHIGELMHGLVVASLAEPAGGTDRRSVNLETLRSLSTTVTGQLRSIGRVQAIMSVLEGYSNFVMHRVGRTHIPEFDRLESAFRRRQGQRSLIERLVLAVTGIAVKLRQYQVGEAFCDAAESAGGIALLNRVWEGPQTMPTMAELRTPSRWISRVQPSG
ncbi:MAG TPA: zinc-dependent metalloprotease [Candidatus Binatia bacterium]|nr:zinc-dependent metalloprotease [Candidatus Binatia bacterium]